MYLGFRLNLDLLPFLLLAAATFNHHHFDHLPPFKKHCINILRSQTKIFHDEIFIIKFFLHPAYRRIAVSKKHSLSSIGQMILRVAKSWKLSRAEATFLQDSINCYYSPTFPFSVCSPGF
ncbi:uncharacterized protein VP01_823g1 [Puccinia sorghi]|uniref:Uncharacterized protein n=1 Tax=Puccinia sorghi TaxID=27349 RepID=A0A0L6UA09_9BASI|nr:uncharacterized protein VP01_823g1 [Puccinia sorghi]